MNSALACEDSFLIPHSLRLKATLRAHNDCLTYSKFVDLTAGANLTYSVKFYELLSVPRPVEHILPELQILVEHSPREVQVWPPIRLPGLRKRKHNDKGDAAEECICMRLVCAHTIGG